MDPRIRRSLALARAVLHEVRTERITFMAGSVAYHAFVSLLPLLLLALAVIATVGDASLREGFIRLTQAVLTPGASEVLVDELQRAGESAGVSAFGLAVLVWGTLRIFRGLDTAFSDVYESESRNSFADQLRDGVVVLVAFGLAVLVAVGIESAVDVAGTGLVPWLLRRVVLVVGLAVALFPIYYVFPDVDVSVAEVVPGVLVAAVGLTAFESLFQLYIAYRAGPTGAGVTGAEGGVVAAILVLLTWLYFSGLVILLGAAVNAVLSNRSDDVDVRPVFGGTGTAEADRLDRSRDGDADPNQDGERAALRRRLDRLEDLLRDAETVAVTVDGETVEFPRPWRTAVTVDTSRHAPTPGPVGIELRWAPRDTDDPPGGVSRSRSRERTGRDGGSEAG